jgi:hypothetical protein
MRSPSAARIRQGYLCQMDQNEVAREVIAQDWLPRYTGMPVDQFGDYVLLTNFRNYVDAFADRFDCEVKGTNRPMQAASNGEGLTIVNFGIGTANAATIMDLLTARMPKGVLFLGKCGGLKQSTEIGHFILPIAAIRGEGTSDDYFPPEVPALPSFKLHKFVSEKIVDRGLEYRTGVVYTTNRRLWDQISRGALLLVSEPTARPSGVTAMFELDEPVHLHRCVLHLHGILHRELLHDRLDEAGNDHRRRLVLGEPAGHEIEQLVLADLGHRRLMADLGVVLLDLHVGIGVGPAVLVEDEGIAADEALGVLGTRLHPHETAVAGATATLGDRLGDDRRGGVGGDVDHLGPGVLMLALTLRKAMDSTSPWAPGSISQTAGYFMVRRSRGCRRPTPWWRSGRRRPAW